MNVGKSYNEIAILDNKKKLGVICSMLFLSINETLIDDPRINERNVDQFIIKKRRKFNMRFSKKKSTNVIVTHNKNLTQS
jgi:hypothetical protein